MKKLFPLLILIPIFAAGPSGVDVWKAADLKPKRKNSPPK